jgi:Ca2+-transporting ATPase
LKESTLAFAAEQREREKEYAEMCSLPQDKLAKRFETDLVKGLSRSESDKRLEKYGQNLIPKVKRGLFKVWIAPFLNLLIAIYLVITTVLAFFAFFILHETGLRLTMWFFIILLNAGFAMVQQARAQKKIGALQRLIAPKCEVIRDGEVVTLPSEQIVPGDIVKLERGNRVPADGRIIAASSLRANEAALTGESDEVEKSGSDASEEKNVQLWRRKNMLFLGTYVTSGSAKYLVTRTGRDTELGRISKNLQELGTHEIPLVKKVNRLARYLGIAVLIYLSISLSYSLFDLYSGGDLFVGGVLNLQLLAETVVRNLITSMSIMPINIPLLTTIILLTGILAMSSHQVVVRDLSAVESLGRISVVCSDKTGTITKNEMTAKWICCPNIKSEDPSYTVTGVGFEPAGKIVQIDPKLDMKEILNKGPDSLDGEKTKVESGTALEYILLSSKLDNDSEIIKETVNLAGKERTVYKAAGNATDASLLVLYHKSGLDEKAYRSRFEEIRAFPFDSKLKCSTRVLKDKKKGKYVLFTKGATEVLLPRCNYVAEETVTEPEELGAKDKKVLNEKADLFASKGYRVISFAFTYLDKLSPTIKIDEECVQGDLTYLGFVAIMDPPREGVRESVSEAKEAGIKPVMITGDNIETARSIAREVGIAEDGDSAAEGSQIESMTDKQFIKTSVFARVAPEHKMNIVDRYKRQHRVVAMTGDGVNDALAISKADVGIATGITGTDVAKQAADMIITDDSFNSIIAGIRQGRGLFQKIRLIVFFYIAVNFAEAMLYFGSSLMPGFYLLNPWQQIFIFSTAHTIPPLAIIVGHLSKYVMKEKPRDTEGILNKHLAIALFIYAVSLAFMFYLVYFETLNGTIPFFAQNVSGIVTPASIPGDPYNPITWAQAKARTMLFTTLIIAECPLILSLSRMYKPREKIQGDKSNRWILWPFVLLIPIVYVALMYIPDLQTLMIRLIAANFEIIPLTMIDWVVAFGLGLVPILLLELYITFVRRRGHSF